MSASDGWDTLATMMRDWLDFTNHGQQCQYLQQHLQLLDDDAQDLMESCIDVAEAEMRTADGTDDTVESAQAFYHLQQQRYILCDARARGRDQEAVLAAYINLYGGLFPVNVPPWMDGSRLARAAFAPTKQRYDTAAERADELRYLLARAEHSTGMSEEAIAELWCRLGTVLWEDRRGPRTEMRDAAIQAFEKALIVYTYERYPRQWASVQNHLGLLYDGLDVGSWHDNCERAIQCYQAALSVCALGEFPLEYSGLQSNLGLAFVHRLAGNRRDNIEAAIACYEAAAQIYKREHFPADFASIQLNLGTVYERHVSGSRRANINTAISCYQKALQIYTPQNFPVEYAQTQLEMGVAYGVDLAGDSINASETAIQCLTRALEVYDSAAYPFEHASAQAGLGDTYLRHIVGCRTEHIERAIYHYRAALRIWTRRHFPVQYASATINLGEALGSQAELLEDNHVALRRRALACFSTALQIFTKEEYPLQFRNTQLRFAHLLLDGLAMSTTNTVGEDAKKQERDASITTKACSRAHGALIDARQAQVELGWLETDPQGRAILQGEHRLVRDMYALDAWCLWRLGDVIGAAVALEAGRAQALAESLSLVGATLDNVCSPHALTFREARDRWDEARLRQDRAELQAARSTLFAARRAIREHCQPEFLPGEWTFSAIAASPAPGQALIYLTPTDHGGLAIVIPPASGVADETPVAHAIPLPELTEARIDEWLIRTQRTLRATGGYQIALQRRVLALLSLWLERAESEAERSHREQTPLNALAPILSLTHPTLAIALTAVIQTWNDEYEQLRYDDQRQQTRARRLRAQLARPLADWLFKRSLYMRLKEPLAWWFQRAELDDILSELRSSFMERLRTAMSEIGLDSRTQAVALVPCGRLSAFPMHAVPVGEENLPFAETCELTYQASARSLAAARQVARKTPPNGPILAVGNPRHHAPTANLPFAEDEARAIIHLARRAGRARSRALSGAQATHKRLLAELTELRQHGEGGWVHLAGHGRASSHDPHASYMLLSGYDAQGRPERLSLAMLQRERLFDGLWGVSASGCVTGLTDVERAPDELSSFAAGLLQAGGACVVATLWSVKDHATCLLMVQFHRLRLTTPGLTPALAMREAARWLRTATREQLDQFALEVGLPTMSTVDITRDAIRGLEPEVVVDGPFETLNEMDLPTRVNVSARRTRKAQSGALLAVDPHVTAPAEEPWTGASTELRPYQHPIYWAAAIIYGAS